MGTTDKLDDVWATRDFRVLPEVVRRFETGDRIEGEWGQSVADALNLSPEDV
jgi:hypothetical protein